MKYLKKFLRKIIRCRSNETIRDCMHRHKYNFLKRIIKTEYTKEDFKKILENSDINKGDTIFVQSSWRAFVGFKGSPEDIINILTDLIGEEGILMMPTFSGDIQKIDIMNDSSQLGVITEVFRKKENTYRSLDSYFPLSILGNNSKYFAENHLKSCSPFDNYSPMYQLLENNGKLLFLGLGKYPHKVSFIHMFTTLKAKSSQFYQICYSKELDCEIKIGEKKYSKKILIRNANYSNNKNNIKKALKVTTHENNKIGITDIYSCCTDDLMKTLEEFEKNSIRFYKVKKERSLWK